MPVMCADTHTSYSYLAPQYRPLAHAIENSRAARLVCATGLGHAFDAWYYRAYAKRGSGRAARVARLLSPAALRCALNAWHGETYRGDTRITAIDTKSPLRRYIDAWYGEMCTRLDRNAVLTAMLERRAAVLSRPRELCSAFAKWHGATCFKYNRNAVLATTIGGRVERLQDSAWFVRTGLVALFAVVVRAIVLVLVGCAVMLVALWGVVAWTVLSVVWAFHTGQS